MRSNTNTNRRPRRDESPRIREDDPPHLVEAYQLRGTMLTKSYRERKILRDDNRRMAIELEAADRTIDRLRAERLTLAKLAAKTPQFFNPLVAWEAEALRDRILNGDDR